MANYFFKDNDNYTDKSSKYEERYLNNQPLHDVKYGGYWGELWLELIDPAHRELDFHKSNWLNEKSKDPFFTYIEKQNISHREPHIDFVLNSDIDSCKVTVKEGLLYKGSNVIDSPEVCNRDNETLFIIDRNMDILVDFSSSTKRHVSLSRGKPVLGGGLLVVEKGHVKEVKGNSGHYLFYTPHMKQSLDILKDKGVELDNNVKITNFLFWKAHVLDKGTVNVWDDEIKSRIEEKVRVVNEKYGTIKR